MVVSLLLLVAAQQPATTQGQTAPLSPSPVARLVVTPAQPVIAAGDSVKLEAQALDAAGQPVPGVRIRFVPAGGFFEGEVDSTGMVRSGSTGTLPVTVVALVQGARPVTHRVEVRMVPKPASRVVIRPAIGRLVAGQRVRMGAEVYSPDGDRRDDAVTWRSSAPGVARVDATGLVTGVAPGSSTLTAAAGPVTQTLRIQVVANTIARIELQPATTAARQGDVIRFTAKALDRRGREIAGLTPAWTVSPGQAVLRPDGAFVGYEPGDYTISAGFGAATAEATVTLAPRDVRRQLQVVGRLPRTQFTTEEVWIHPDGKHAYLGTGSGGDRMFAIDISDPAKPVVTDSIVANTRRVNDIMSTPDGKFLVFTREGASDRKNGIVIASIEDPAHPKVIAEFTEGVTAGVHSAFVFSQERYGTHVYLTNDGTGALHIVDISNPHQPREVAQWKTPRPDVGRTLHDVDVQDGLAYLSYWNDGLVILDVGNGMKGGSPSNPTFVSQFKYDLNALYRDVEARSGPGFIRGTHTAWRTRNYVIIADEVFPAASVEGAKDAAAGRAFGRLQVVDVSDLDNPKSVAWYEPEYGGVHNVWVAGDTLYMGAYNGGYRAFDISGELMGDLRAQAREMVHLHTGDMDGFVKNTPMTWGVVVKDGLAYVNDMYNGLWIVRMKPKGRPPIP